MFIDSHAHLADPAFDADREDAIARAVEAGAEAIVCIGESLAAADRARALAAAHPKHIWWTAGVHPHDAASFDEARDLPAIAEHVRQGAVAVGECGLDYHYDNSPRSTQRAAFAAQLALAGSLGSVVVVHTRDAEADTMELIRAQLALRPVQGVLHCFTGSRSLAEFAVEHGWMVSFSGIITFRKWTDVDVLRAVPDDHLLVESDAPYLAPVPQRGRRNEPAFVPLTIDRLAAARGTPPSVLAARTAASARRLFGLGEASPVG